MKAVLKAPSLTETLNLMLPDLSPALVPPAVHDDVRDLARQLAPVARCGFEVRLDDSQNVDFQQGITTRDDEREQLQRHLGSSPRRDGAWRRLNEFVARWSATSSRLNDGIEDLWLEFDRPPGNSLSVFVGFERGMPAKARRMLAPDVLDVLVERPQRLQWQPALERCMDACTAGAAVSHLGVMVGRSSPFLRVNVKRLEPALVGDFLSAIQWEGNRAAVAALAGRLLALTDGVTLCLDVGEKVHERVGLECYLDLQPPAEQRWTGLLDELVQSGWCTPEKRDALLEWPKFVVPHEAAGEWPAYLVHAGLKRPADHFTSLERRISHVKVTYEEGREPDAKAYFGFLHTWLRPGLDADEPAPATTATRPRPHGVAAAVEGALDFLLDARTGPGWWRDFSGSLDATGDWVEAFGWSDEWVTAYVATALASAPDERAVDAARRAWTLLIERRLPVPGWGYNRRAPVDADSTTWGLKLADALGVLDSRPARDGRRALGRYALPDGGLTTYRPDQCPRPRVAALTSPAGSYGGWCRTSHACVTAAAAWIGNESQSEYLRKVQRADGGWDSYWWETDAYATAFAAEALARQGRVDDASRVKSAVAWALGRLSPNGAVGGSPFETALCVRILRLGESRSDTREALRAAVRWLLDRQETDGGWPASARLLAPRPDVTDPSEHEVPPAATLDEGRNFTTATVLTALLSMESEQ